MGQLSGQFFERPAALAFQKIPTIKTGMSAPGVVGRS
jgi:hypothetical protein